MKINIISCVKSLIFLHVLLVADMADVSLSMAEQGNEIWHNTDKYYTIIPRDAEPELLLDGAVGEPGLTFTEGPSWMNGKLYFSNYYMFWKKWSTSDEGGLIIINSDGFHEVLNKNVQTCGTIPLANGNLAVCDLRACSIVEMNPDGRIIKTLADSYDGYHLGRPNDIVTDAKGGIYFTDPNNSPKRKKKMPGNTIFYLNPHGELIRVTDWDEFGFPNGCILSPDGRTFYVNDSQSFDIWMYDVNVDGTLANKRLFARVKKSKDQLRRKKPRSNADGMTIDTLGNVYVALPSGVQIFDKSGEYIGNIQFPKSPSNCIFGGEDMKTLFATCRDHIYSIRTNVTGLSYPPK